MNRFWIILAIIIIGLGALFVFTKPKSNGNSNFTGDAAKLQPDDHVRGKKDSKVVLMEYGDFQCPACGQYFPIIKSLEADYGNRVAFVFRHYPIISLHPNAFSAARAAEAASNQGKFWEMHDKLYETQNSWGQVTTNQQRLFEEYAKELKLNSSKFTADFTSEAVADRINRDVSSAKQFNITGTPTFILNGNKIDTPQGLTAFKKVLDDALKTSGATQNPPSNPTAKQ